MMRLPTVLHAGLRRLYDRARLLARVMRKASFRTERPARGTVLLSYITEPFFTSKGRSVFSTHSHHWEAVQIVRTYLDLGFNVDVIHYLNRWFRPRKRYDVVVDARFNLERLGPRLAPECIKIFHIDTCHMLFQNTAELRRLEQLQRRRGVTLVPRRHERLNHGIEHADHGVVLGNAHTMATFRYSGKPLHPVPVSTPQGYPSPDGKDIEHARRRFIWLSRGGLVLKGLDRVLEVFAALPDHHLTVCAPVDQEPDFAAAFQQELYASPNIHTLGWVDVSSPAFAELLRESIGIVYPAGSESQSTSVINCLHAGLIPIVTREAGLDVTPEFGVMLADDDIDTVREAVTTLSARPAAELEAMASAAWTFARANHSRESFATAYRAAMEAILGAAGPLPSSEVA